MLTVGTRADTGDAARYADDQATAGDDRPVARGQIDTPALVLQFHALGARQKSRMGLFVRTIGIIRAKAKIGMANLAYNLTRYVWHEGRSVPA